MKKDKRARLERAGWKVGTVRDLLGLSKAEEQKVVAVLTDTLERSRTA